MAINIEIKEVEIQADVQPILAGLLEHNRPFGEPLKKDLVIHAKAEEGDLLGGLVGFTSWQWLFVRLLWVSEKSRSQGVGTELMRAAEDEARRRGCIGVWLDTFSFQALAFYERLGYRQFGKLEDFPPGHQRFFLERRL